MAACASCGNRIVRSAYQERLEFVRGNSKRLRTVILRDPLCESCVLSIADNAKLLDSPIAASLEVAAKLRIYLGPHADDEAMLNAWSDVESAMRRWSDAGEQLTIEGAVDAT